MFSRGQFSNQKPKPGAFRSSENISETVSSLSKIVSIPLALRALFCTLPQGHEGFVNKDYVHP